jgi:uncharacterized membrane protein YdcZ (DUF606 family)
MKLRKFETSLAVIAVLIVLVGVTSAANSAFNAQLSDTLNYGLTTTLKR